MTEQPSPARRRGHDHGFTLVELLIAVTITGVIGSVMLSGVVRSLSVTARATDRVEALTDLERGLARISRDIRAADPIAAASPTSITVTVYDEVTRRRIVYTNTGATITRAVTTFADHTTGAASGNATVVLLDGLDPAASPVFTYVDDTGAAWSSGTPGDISRVQVTLARVVQDGSPVELTASAFVRNTLE